MSTNDEQTSLAGGRGGLVSIVVPYLNAERFLNDAITSILAQTYVRWELLLVNDGSTDRSAMIAERCAQDRPYQVRCLQHADLGRHGISTSRNLGIANSTGEYIAFLDADDVWFPNKLERQVALLGAEPQAAMVFGASLSWHSWTGRTDDLMKDEFAPVLEDGEPEHFVDLPLLSVREVWHTAAPSGILVRRDAAAAVGNFESGFDNLYEDQAFYFKLGLTAKALASHECWYKYRQHPDSECAKGVRSGTQPITKIKFLRWASQYLASSKIERPDLVEAISQELLADAQDSRSPMLQRATKWRKRLKQVRTSDARAILKGVPGVWSTWQLGHALRDAWIDSSPRAKPELKRDFNSADPWNYNSNPLEQIRHHREAEMLDRARSNMRFRRALEIGCAEGAFTWILADRCASLLATDLSDVALERARLRCQHHAHIRFAQIDLRNDILPGKFDLIVAIHVIEYIKNPLTLRRVREKLVHSLQIGGYLLLGSCTGNNEFRESLWWSRYMLRGGRRINEFIASHPALTIVEAEINPLPGSISRDILLQRKN
jgi:GT2 family glycosyltransferase